MIDTELNDKIKLVCEMEAKSKHLKRILKSTYKTGDYSPSKYGLQPTTPVKQSDSLTPNKRVETATQATDYSSSTSITKSGKELLAGEDDDDLLLSADR